MQMMEAASVRIDPLTDAPVNLPETAMVLAAGRGERMRPLTDTVPKPLLKVGGKCLIDWVIDRLLAVGVRRLVVNLCYLGDQIEAHLTAREPDMRDGSGNRVELHLMREEAALETGGGIVNALPVLGDDPFITTNADTLWLNGPAPMLHRLAQHWQPEVMDALLMLQSSAQVGGDEIGRGDFMMQPDGRLRRRKEWEIAPFIFGGVQIVSPKLFHDPPAEKFSVNRLWDRAIEEERLFGMVHDGVWFHVGTPGGLDYADQRLSPRNARWLEAGELD